MTDVNQFRQYAKEAMQESSNAKNESEKLALDELALTWTHAASASDRIFGSDRQAVN